jgi:hypothetical protein
MLPYILIGIAVIIVLLLIVIAMQPAGFKVTRSAKFAALPSAVFANIAEFKKWRAWSPWEAMDPNLQRDYAGPEAGVGSQYHWVGNKKVGEGKMTITDTTPHQRILIKLEFLKPFVATNQAEFLFTPDGDGMTLTWSMTGQRNFMMKGMGLFMNFDKMIGGDFEKGLANLKRVVEV